MIRSRQVELSQSDHAVLLLIDFQGKIFDMAFNHSELLERSQKLLDLAELFQVPVVVSEQYPKGLGPTHPDLTQKLEMMQTEKHMVVKTHFGCCGEPGFNELLSKVTRSRKGKNGEPCEIIVCGIESHICVLQTVLGLLRLGYRVSVLEDCIGGRHERLHDQAVERFRQAGAVLSNFESLAFEWTFCKDHPNFKKMSSLMK